MLNRLSQPLFLYRIIKRPQFDLAYALVGKFLRQWLHQQHQYATATAALTPIANNLALATSKAPHQALKT
jgi:hypothetical protein